MSQDQQNGTQDGNLTSEILTEIEQGSLFLS